MAGSNKDKKSSSSSGPNRSSDGVKFSRRTSSGRLVSLSRDEETDNSGEYAGPNDYINYTVMMPPTPDNQPGVSSNKQDGQGSSRSGTQDAQKSGKTRKGGGGDGGGGESGKMDRRMSVMRNSNNNKSMLLRSQTTDFDHNRWLFESKGKYGIGNAYWPPEDDEYANENGVSPADFLDKPWKPLTRKIHVPASVLSPYRYIFHYKYL